MRIRSTCRLRPAAPSRERGAVLFLLVGAVLVVLLGGALAVDLSIVANRGQKMQNAADAAALAGVQAYRQSGGNEAVAEAAVANLLQQNGISTGGSTTYSITFPDTDNDTEVSVTLFDTEPGTLMGGVTGIDSDVERTATAAFNSCQADCTVSVVIPSPFRSVDAAGTGDGYKPIPVNNQLYALNHNSSYGGIVCIDRSTEANCWSSGASKPAYATGGGSQRNPEMPHTAVFETKIYWAASDSSGTKLFCFETTTATPCSTPYLINNRSRASSSDISNQKDRNRGGGTALVAGKIFVFTDDWRVHCFNPDTGSGISRCAGYEANGLPSSLARTPYNFPTNEPADGNHGSSIDRIVDEDNDRVYWTTHVTTSAAAPADCSLGNQQFPSGLVSIQNVQTGKFMRTKSNNDVDDVSSNDANDTHWVAEAEGVDGSGNMRYSFRNVAYGRWLDADSGSNSSIDTSSSVADDDKWVVGYGLTGSTMRTSYGTYAQDSSGDFRTRTSTNGSSSDWVIKHPNCFNPLYVPGPPALGYAAGTWLQCWSAISGLPCAGFTPYQIHTDGSRFSGRLFFHYDSAASPNIQGVCSTGFEGYVDNDTIELNCVDDVTGVFSAGLTSNLASLLSTIDGVTDGSPAAWGDPHYNEHTNRLFYPSAHDISRVICWDFDYGSCGMVQGYSGTNGYVEDYGFFSEGDCVYGLGHNAVFWAFKAGDINSECTGSTTRTRIEPCDCSGDWEWGTITFDVDLAQFDEFFIIVKDPSGEVVYPTPDPANPDDPGHSLHADGLTIDLNHLPVSGDPATDFLEIIVTVSAEDDPWASGEQTFSVEFARAPRLID